MPKFTKDEWQGAASVLALIFIATTLSATYRQFSAREAPPVWMMENERGEQVNLLEGHRVATPPDIIARSVLAACLGSATAFCVWRGRLCCGRIRLAVRGRRSTISLLTMRQPARPTLWWHATAGYRIEP
jgi:hypothetical protein